MLARGVSRRCNVQIANFWLQEPHDACSHYLEFPRSEVLVTRMKTITKKNLHLQTQPALLVNISIFLSILATAVQISWSLRFSVFFSQRQIFSRPRGQFHRTIATHVSSQLTKALDHGNAE